MKKYKSKFIEPELLKKYNVIDNVFNHEEYCLSDEITNVYKYFDEKFTRLSSTYAELFGIKEYSFYIRNSSVCNAYAARKKGYSIIGITNAYPILISRKFMNDYVDSIYDDVFKNKDLSYVFQKLKVEDGLDYGKFFIDCSIKFTFGHEFRHIRQLNVDKSYCGNMCFQENLDKEEYSKMRHIYEFDADRQGAYDVIKFVFQTHVSLKKRTNDKMECLLYLGCASMVITTCLYYFGLMNQIDLKYIDKQDFYLEKYSHPHHLVRIDNIINFYKDIVMDELSNFRFEYTNFIDNVFKIVDLYFKKLMPNNELFDDFLNDLLYYMVEIDKYNNNLYDGAISDNIIRRLLISSNTKFEGYGL